MSSFIIAFSMYSKIPMPRVEWTKNNMRYALCFFPFVGVLVGAIEYLVSLFLLYFHVSKIIIGAVLIFVPIIITGGIHLDGFVDTVDAVMSYKTKEEKLKILDDPHVGAFSVIWCVMYLILSFAFFSEISRKTVCFIAYIFVFSRILSGISVISFPKAKEGLVKTFSDSSDKKVFGGLISELFIAILFTIYFCGFMFLIPVGSALLAFLFYYILSKKIFGGTSGDQCGAFLCIVELIMLCCTYIIGLFL